MKVALPDLPEDVGEAAEQAGIRLASLLRELEPDRPHHDDADYGPSLLHEVWIDRDGWSYGIALQARLEETLTDWNLKSFVREAERRQTAIERAWHRHGLTVLYVAQMTAVLLYILIRQPESAGVWVVAACVGVGLTSFVAAVVIDRWFFPIHPRRKASRETMDRWRARVRGALGTEVGIERRR